MTPIQFYYQQGALFFFTGLKRQLNSADATSAGQDKHANFDLVAVLTLFLAGNVLTDIQPNRTEPNRGNPGFSPYSLNEVYW